MAQVIRVSQEDIDSGIRRSLRCCPIARAAKRKFPDVEVADTQIGFTHRGKWLWLTLPPKARDFVRTFDRGYRVFPLEFEIQIPEG